MGTESQQKATELDGDTASRANHSEDSKAETGKQSKKFQGPEDGPIWPGHIPPHPGPRPSLEQINEFLSGLSAQGLRRASAYLYRTYPVIDRQQVNPNNMKHLEPLAGPVDESEVRRKYGGGGYKIMISVNPQVEGPIVCYFNIPEDGCEPIVDPHELKVHHKDNYSYVAKLKARGVLDKDGNVMKQGDAAMGDLVSSLVDKLDAAKKGDISGTELLSAVSAMIANNSAETSKTLLAMAERQLAERDALLAERGSDGGMDLLPMMQFFFEQQNQITKTQIEFLQAQLGTSAAPASVVDEVDKLVTLKEKLDNLGANGKASQGWAEVVAPPLSKLAEAALVFAMGYFTQKTGQAPPTASASAPAAASPAPAVTAPAASEAAQVARPAPPPLPPGGYKSPIAPFVHNNVPLLLASLSGGENGATFAARARAMIKDDARFRTLSLLGTEGLLAGLREVPQFWNHVGTTFTEERVKAWVSEFVAAVAAVAEGKGA